MDLRWPISEPQSPGPPLRDALPSTVFLPDKGCGYRGWSREAQSSAAQASRVVWARKPARPGLGLLCKRDHLEGGRALRLERRGCRGSVVSLRRRQAFTFLPALEGDGTAPQIQRPGQSLLHCLHTSLTLGLVTRPLGLYFSLFMKSRECPRWFLRYLLSDIEDAGPDVLKPLSIPLL